MQSCLAHVGGDLPVGATYLTCGFIFIYLTLQLKRIMGYIESGKQEGARLVCGGKLADVPSAGTGKGGLFVAPTIFADVKASMTIFREEIFGPVLCVTSFKTLDDAISIANDSEYVDDRQTLLTGWCN